MQKRTFVLALCITLYTLALINVSEAQSFLSLVDSTFISDIALASTLDTETGRLYMANADVLFEYDPVARAVATRLAVPPIPLDFQGKVFGDKIVMNVVRWRREGLFDRRFLAICNDAFLYVALLDNSGLISNQTLVASYTFDPFISTAPVPGGVVGCAPHFGADGNVAIWATVNDGFRGSPQSGTYVYKMSPISVESLNQPSWIGQKWLVANSFSALDFTVQPVTNQGIIVTDDPPPTSIAFSLVQPTGLTTLTEAARITSGLRVRRGVIADSNSPTFWVSAQDGSFSISEVTYSATQGFTNQLILLVSGEGQLTHTRYESVTKRLFLVSESVVTRRLSRIPALSGTQYSRERFIDVPVNGTRARALAIDVIRNRAYVISVSNTTSFTLIEKFQLATCPAATNCTSCVSADSNYCSWCVDSSSATCSFSPSCVASRGTRLRLTTCPLVSSALPSSSSTTGGGVVSLSGTNLVNDSSTTCIFTGASVSVSSPATFELDGSVTCAAPESTLPGAGNVRLGFASVPVSDNSAPFQYYDCSQLTNCSSCANAANRDCVWCAVDAVCSSRFSRPNVCPTPFAQVVDASADTTLKCAQLISVTPRSELTTPPPGATVTIQASYLVNSTTGWSCRFGSFATVPATVNLVASTVTCTVPTHPTPTFRGNVDLAVLYRDTAYALNSLSFYYYDCGSGSSGCSDCVTALQPRCAWCLSQKACYAAGSSSATSCPDISTEQCPRVVPQPRSSFFNEAALLSIVDGPFTSVASNTYECVFGSFGTVAAQFVNSTLITCTAPVVNLGGNAIVDVPLTIRHTGSTYSTSTAPFRFYDCSGTNCSTCAGALMPRCSWCFSEAYCDLESVVSASSCAAPVTTCPQVTSASASVAATHGGLNLVLTGTRFFSTLTYHCIFTPENVSFAPINVTANVLSTTQLNCTTPVFPDQGSWTISVFSGSQLLETPLPLLVVDCNNQTSCSTCTRTPQCSWCPATPSCIKTELQTCSSGIPLSSCPSITIASPNASEIWRSKTVTLEGSLLDRAAFGNTIDSLVCSFGPAFDDLSPATAITGPTTGQPALSCQTPLQPAPSNINVGVSIVDLNGRIVPYATGPTFEYFDCRRATDCATCEANPSTRCGWCLSSDRCVPVEQCPQSNFWTRLSCPVVTAIAPTFSDISSPAVVTVTGTRFDPSFDLVCVFDSVEATATVVNSETVTCTPPRRASSGTVSVTVRKKGRSTPFATTSTLFEYISCNRNSLTPLATCRSCIPAIDSRCGWCLLDQKCAPQGLCPGTISNVTYLTSSCPSVSSFSPTEAIASNSTSITILGSLFEQIAGLTCRFGPYTAFQATVINSTTLTCVTPSIADVGQNIAVDFALVIGNNTYADSQLGFTFRPYQPPSVPSSNVPPPQGDGSILSDRAPAWVFVIIAIAILIVIGIIAIMIVLYVRRRRAEAQLTPPDFNAIAFANNTRLMYIVPSDRSSALLGVPPLILGHDFQVPIMLSRLSSAGEDDLLSRALVFASLKSGRALDMLIALIDYEIDVADVKQEGELFRSNSLACKFFTIYSKVIGLEFLWKTLARAINSLNHAGELEEAKAGKAEAGEAPLADVGLLEVDPERLAEKLERDVDAAVLAEVSSSQYQLLLYCGRIFKRLVDCMDNVPVEFKTVAARVKQGVAKKFTQNNADYKAVGAFFFLRFVCPAVMTPQVYGLLQNPPGETSQRYFVLMSKVLQNLANETLPGDKEDYMAPMNPFVQENLGALHKLIDNLADDSDLASNTHHGTAREIPKDIYESSLAHLHNFMVDHDDDMNAKFGPKDQLVPKIRECTNDVGASFKSQAAKAKAAKKKK